MRSPTNDDDWTIDRWQVERPLKGIQMPVEWEEDEADESGPPLWKDVTLASVVAIMLWGAVAMVLG